MPHSIVILSDGSLFNMEPLLGLLFVPSYKRMRPLTVVAKTCELMKVLLVFSGKAKQSGKKEKVGVFRVVDGKDSSEIVLT